MTPGVKFYIVQIKDKGLKGCYATKSSRPDQGAPIDVEGILPRP